jgi:succinyl-diaminopimelate desuccinylase
MRNVNLEKLQNHVDEQLVKEITTKLVSFDSQNPPGHCDHIAAYLEKLCENLGLETKKIVMDDDSRKVNLLVYYGEGDRDIVLSGHFDTVPVGDKSLWDYPPLEVTEEDGKLFGRGTADMKGGVATLLATMVALKEEGIKLSHRLVFAGTADEEVGMTGATKLAKSGVMDNADGLIITEATSLRVAIAEKGPFWIKMNVEGIAAHGSMPEEGANAIEGACLAIKELKALVPQTKHPLLGKSTLNIGKIKGGVKTNIVPEKCSFECDFRLIPEIDQEEFKSKITQHFSQLSESTPYTFSYELLHSIPALSASPDEPLIKNLVKWSNQITEKPKEPIGVTYGTDAAALIPPREIPFAIIGGGSSSIIHKVNEFAPLNELVTAAQIIALALAETYSTK